MTPPKEPDKSKHKKAHHHSNAHQEFNTPENAIKSVETCRSLLDALVPSKVWSHLTHHDEFDLKGSFALNEEIVLVLHFSPEDGSVLPKGLHGLGHAKPGVVENIQNKLEKIKSEIFALDGAEFREPESCWAIPIAYQSRIIGHMKVSANGERILADKKATEEIAAQNQH
jgi:hypothetical protein